ncbi:MAG: Na(+) H(+) antiporter subunit A [Firmicutes bacterium]|nr:Na(+) H(+) antiporter subunit A [Bacillota bacterium]MDI6705450.1 proton-conducting transporter membrane subunit [Bacillota bacterium]
MEKTMWLIYLPVLLPVLGLVLMIRASKKYILMERVFSITSAVLVFIINVGVIYWVSKGYTVSVPPLKVNNFLQIHFQVDRLGALFAFLASLMWIFVTVYSFGYMRGHAKQLRYFAFFTVCLGITMGIAYSANLFTLYIFYELLTVATYPLVVHKEDKKALDAGKKYLIYSFSGAALILIGMILVYALTGTLDFVPGGGTAFRGALPMGVPVAAYFVLFFVGFGVKSALVPLHSWLPAAMVAPTPVSALLHAVAVVKAGVFSMTRAVYYVFGPEAIKGFNAYFVYIVAFSILFGSVLAIGQTNLKRRLAYSTISQLGYVLLGVLLVNSRGYTGGVLHIVNHGLIKIVLFLCAGAIITRTGKTEINQLKGIGKQMPVTMGIFALASVCLVGIPPTNGFVSKWYLSLGSLDAGQPLLVAVLLLSALLTAAYLFPIVGIAFFTKGDREIQGVEEAPRSMLYPLVALAFLMLASGAFADRIIDFLAGGLEEAF